MPNRDLPEEKVFSLVCFMLTLRSFAGSQFEAKAKAAEARIFDHLHTGAAWTFDSIAQDVGVPVQVIIERFQQEMAAAGFDVRPLGRTN